MKLNGECFFRAVKGFIILKWLYSCWRELVADRKKWKDIVRQAKAHGGL